MINEGFIEKKEYEAQLDNRWGWITEGIQDRDVEMNTKLVLENSYKKMVSEGGLPRGWLENNILSEETLTEAPQRSSAVGDYVIPKVMFPIIRRVMPELIANKLISVQPIQAPTGVIYYITYNYSNTKGEIVKGDEFSANPQQTTPAFATWYSSEKIGPLTATVVAADADLDIVGGTKITNFLGTDSSEYAIKRFEIYNTTTGKALPVVFGTTKDNVTYDGATGTITILGAEFANGLLNAGDKLTAFLVYDQEGSKRIPEMEFSIEHMNVSTTERKLKVRWTKESEQDMQAYHKIDVEAELVKVAAVQTNYEIDREVMKFIDDSIIPALAKTHNWTADDPVTGNNASGNYLDRHRALAQKLYQVSTKIAEFNHLGPADWAVCSPQIAAVLQMLPDWKAGEIASGKSSFYNAGALGNGSLNIYVDPNRAGAQANEITLGHKSKDSTYGAGVVYSPYANWMSSTVTHPETFDSVRGFFSRYALTLCPRGEYNYGRVILDNLLLD